MANDRNRETSLWNWLKDHLKELRPLTHDIQRIENSCAKGTPDVEGCIEGDTFWCELKVGYERAGDHVLVKITTPQVLRAKRRCRAGGRSWVLVRMCGATWRDNEHFLIRGEDAEELLQPIPRARLIALSVVQPKSAAVEILKALVGRY